MAAVALVTGTGTASTTADQRWQSLLQGLGHTVTLVDDAAAVSAGKDLHVIGDSCSSTSIGTKYEDIDVAVIVCDVDCPDQVKMFTGTNANATGTTWTIIAHEITAGLTPGTVTMKTGGNSGRWGWLPSTVGAGAEIFATNPSSVTGETGIFRVLGCAYDEGSLDTDGNPMPARRVYLAYVDSFAGTLNANGDLVFTQAVGYALDTGGAVLDLAGSAASTSATSSAMTADMPLTGSAASVSSAVGTVTADMPLAGAAASTSSTSGQLATVMDLADSALSQSATNAALTALLDLVGQATSLSSTSGELTSPVDAAAIVVGELTGPNRREYQVTGPVTRRTVDGTVTRRQVTGTASAVITTTGPALVSVAASGPEPARTVTGTATSRTVTGSET